MSAFIPEAARGKKAPSVLGKITPHTSIVGPRIVIGRLESNVPDQEKDHCQPNMDEQATNRSAETHLGLKVPVDREPVDCIY
jgi:hypothetical protein